MNTNDCSTKETEPKQRFILPVKYYNASYTLNILYIFAYYVHYVHFRISQFSINA